MGVAVQKGAGQGILRGDSASVRLEGSEWAAAPQWQGGGALRRPTCQQGRHLAERVWYGTGNGKVIQSPASSAVPAAGDCRITVSACRVGSLRI